MNGMATARKLLLGQPINPSAPRPTDSPSSSVSPSVPTGSAGSYKKTPDIGFEVLPGLLFGDMEKVEDFTKFAQNYSTTYYHACGTCAMQTGRSAAAGRCLAKQKGDQGQESAGITNPGPESECECNDCLAVVDADLKVLGVLNLRVGDASVFPRISSGPTSATCMAVGIGLGRLILAEGREKSCL